MVMQRDVLAVESEDHRVGDGTVLEGETSPRLACARIRLGKQLHRGEGVLQHVVELFKCGMIIVVKKRDSLRSQRALR